MRYKLRDLAVATFGELQTASLVRTIVDDLREKFGDQLGYPKP